MRRLVAFLALLIPALSSPASWYWPFGSDGSDGEKPVRRLSEIMEPVSLLIDEASDLAMDGKPQEAVAKYREALKKLDDIEAEEPDRVKTPEFATVRNKRAYVNAAIDSLLLEQVRSNASSVAVSDTTELEKKLAEEKNRGKAKPETKKPETRKGEAETLAAEAKEAVSAGGESAARAQAANAAKASPAKPLTRRERIMRDIDGGKFDDAAERIGEMLAEKPNSAAALNLKAMLEMAQGKVKDAEKTLDQAIMSNPRSHFAYYNMAELLLQTSPEAKDAARRYYETGRTFGGPKDERLEEALK